MGGISSMIGAVALLGFLAFLAGVGMVVVSASQGRPVRGGILLALLGLVFGIVLTVIGRGVIVVEPGEVAVIFNTLGGDLEEPPLQSGTHIVMPILQEATIYSVLRQEYTMSGTEGEGAQFGDDAIAARTSDGQNVEIDITVIFNVNPQKAHVLHPTWGNNPASYIQGFVRPTVRSVLRDEVAGTTAESLYSTGRQEMRNSALELLTTEFDEEGLILQDIRIRSIDFSEEFSAAIEEKQTEEQRRQRAETEAQRLLVEAQGRANAVRAEAQGNADAVVLAAEAQAQALKLISEQIAANPLLIQYEYIQNLAPNINMALIPSNSPFLFDFNSMNGLPEANPDFEAPDVPETEAESSDGN